MVNTRETAAAEAALHRWSAESLNLDSRAMPPLEMVSGDASFRRYYRLSPPGQKPVIAVHAPPDKENNEAFVAVQSLFFQHGVRVPALLGWQRDQGFLLQEDFGGQLLLPLLKSRADAEHYYTLAMDAMLQMQRIPLTEAALPQYDHALLWREMALFTEWFVAAMLEYTLKPAEKAMVDGVFEQLCHSALAQPQVPVHRDFHSRNIMVLENGELGLIDFQDAVCGPATYDLVSLLRDCYVAWPQADVETWALQYHRAASTAGVPLAAEGEFIRQFDLMGLQRHIKVLGIFARLYLRDGKAGYLDDLPLVIAYVLAVAEKYPELTDFCRWFRSALLPLARQQSWYRERLL